MDVKFYYTVIVTSNGSKTSNNQVKRRFFMRSAGKKSIIGGIVALSLILVGTGYAYWTDTLNVTTKATTGDLDVTFVDLGLFAQYGNEASPNNDFTGNWSIVDGVQHGDNNGFVDDLFFARGTTNYNSIAETDPDTIAQYKDEASGYNTVNFDAQLTGSSTLKKDVGPYTTATKNSDNIVLTVEKMYPGYAQAFRTDIVNQGTIAAKLSNMIASFRIISPAAAILQIPYLIWVSFAGYLAFFIWMMN